MRRAGDGVLLRGLLLLLFAVGVAGAVSDLLLIGHVDGRAQQIPVVLLAAGLGVCAWLIARGAACRVARVSRP